MSIFTDSRAVIFIADYASDEGNGKVGALGIGFRVVGMNPNGLSAPQTVVVMIDVPAKHIGQQFPISLELRRSDNDQIVKMIGPTGQQDSLRVQQMVSASPNGLTGVYLPPDFGGRVQVVMQFPNGIQLEPGVTYHWKLEIEGQHNKQWVSEFHMAGPPPQPIIGGPADHPTESMPPLTEYVVPQPKPADAPGDEPPTDQA
ncbi:hypothetical protein EFK50_00940 [Nocardioides marmoriginsengisoli]|uniref:Uncharacterized protein n=1 Tax=Nocardioides marmoriginsengisoli TaxID=661483 RepID=A0A3N0CRV9_9ACTN|nr:hypothetical protein [Nocardioides marmoriginsengisoli]RNL66222.1 hypothetical protein EFK50_00940 [Nocardioides marmoriginsengisoli]